MRVPLAAAVLAVVLAILATAWVWSLPRPVDRDSDAGFWEAGW